MTVAEEALATMREAGDEIERLRAALQAQEDADDARDTCPDCAGEGQWEHCGPCSERFGDALVMRRAALVPAATLSPIKTEPTGKMIHAGCAAMWPGDDCTFPDEHKTPELAIYAVWRAMVGASA